MVLTVQIYLVAYLAYPRLGLSIKAYGKSLEVVFLHNVRLTWRLRRADGLSALLNLSIFALRSKQKNDAAYGRTKGTHGLGYGEYR